MRHARIGDGIVEELRRGAHDGVRIGADEACHTRCDDLWPLRRVAENEDRLAEARRFLLQTARVREDDIARVEDMNELEIVEWLTEVDAVDMLQRREHDVADRGASMDREEDLGVFARRKRTDSLTDGAHRLALTLAPVDGEEKSARAYPRDGRRKTPRAVHRPPQRIDDRVPRHMHRVFGNCFCKEVLGADRCRAEVECAILATTRRFSSSGKGA
jgi:hypothetical protein